MKNISILFACFVLSSGTSFAEREKVGNGGGGFECKNPRGETLSVHLLDIFEGLNPLYPRSCPYHYREQMDGLETDAFIAQAMERAKVNPVFFEEFKNTMATVLRSIEFLQPNTRLVITDDAYPEIGMKDCSFVQIANYYVENGEHQRVDIVPELYTKMNALHQAGLLVHEAVYSITRRYGLDTNSKRARVITAMLMAEDELSNEILAETSQIISPKMDDQAKKILQGCQGYLVSGVVRLSGPATLVTSLNEANGDTTKSDGSAVSYEFSLPCEQFKSLRWSTYPLAEGSKRQFSAQIFLSGKMIFSRAGIASGAMSTDFFSVR